MIITKFSQLKPSDVYRLAELNPLIGETMFAKLDSNTAINLGTMVVIRPIDHDFAVKVVGKLTVAVDDDRLR